MLRSFSNNSWWYRIFVFILGLLVIFGLNYFLFAYFKNAYSLTLVLLWIFCSILLYFFLRWMKYTYTIKDNFLLIKTPSKQYKIPFSDIEKVWMIESIPFVNKLFLKFDQINHILYLMWFYNKWIAIKLPTHTIVISPRKMDEFYDILKNI